MNPFAILCPGQGDQNPRMFDLAQTYPSAADFIKTNLSPIDISKNLFSNVYAQPLVVAASLANWLAIKDHIPKPNLIAAYSVGEITAHAVSGSIEPALAVELAKARAKFMQSCVETNAPQGMMAVTGPAVAKVLEYLRQTELYLAIKTGPNSCVIAGLVSNLKVAEIDLAKFEGKPKLTPLHVHVASHTTFMKKATQDFADHLKKIKFEKGVTAVLAGTNAERVTQPQEIKKSLADQISKPIQWSDCLDQIHEQGMNFALELGPGSALSKMLSDRYPRIQARSIADFRSLQAAINWVNDRATN